MGTAGAPSGDATKGKTTYSGNQAGCNVCHGANGEGQLGPNITGSTAAGIGTWTYAEFSNQIRTLTKKDGTKNCSTAGMPAYTATDLPDADVADIYAYLMSVKNETPNKGSACP